MSIRGIDTQIMITRAAEAVKDTSALLKHPQISQENTADRNRADSIHDQSRVLATEESEMENVRTDVDSEGSGAAGGGGGRKEEEEPEEEQDELEVAQADYNRFIDITV